MYISFHLCLLLDWFHVHFPSNKQSILPGISWCSYMLLILRQNENLCSEAKGDVHSVPFCTGLYCSVKHPLNPPTWCILLSGDLFITPCEKRNFLSPLCQKIPLWVLKLWTVGRTAATFSSVPSETLLW